MRYFVPMVFVIPLFFFVGLKLPEGCPAFPTPDRVRDSPLWLFHVCLVFCFFFVSPPPLSCFFWKQFPSSHYRGFFPTFDGSLCVFGLSLLTLFRLRGHIFLCSPLSPFVGPQVLPPRSLFLPKMAPARSCPFSPSLLVPPVFSHRSPPPVEFFLPM